MGLPDSILRNEAARLRDDHSLATEASGKYSLSEPVRVPLDRPSSFAMDTEGAGFNEGAFDRDAFSTRQSRDIPPQARVAPRERLPADAFLDSSDFGTDQGPHDDGTYEDGASDGGAFDDGAFATDLADARQAANIEDPMATGELPFSTWDPPPPSRVQTGVSALGQAGEFFTRTQEQQSAVPGISDANGSSTGQAVHIARAVRANHDAIQVLAQSLLFNIAEQLQEIRRQRLNSDESYREIAAYERLHLSLENFLKIERRFTKGDINDVAVAKGALSFTEGVQNWWKQEHVSICNKVTSFTLYSSAAILGHLVGAPGALSVLAAGVVVGGKDFADAAIAYSKPKNSKES